MTAPDRSNCSASDRPRIGVGVMVWKHDRLLLGRRINSRGEKSWQLPGGHLEFGETVEACARREVAEEAGITIHNIVHAGYTNDVFIEADRHYVTLFVTAAWKSGEPRVCICGIRPRRSHGCGAGQMRMLALVYGWRAAGAAIHANQKLPNTVPRPGKISALPGNSSKRA